MNIVVDALVLKFYIYIRKNKNKQIEHPLSSKAATERSLRYVKKSCKTKRKSKCFKKGGKCITKQEAATNCQTKKVGRFCKGRRCTCCLPAKRKKKCKTRKKFQCYLKGGRCMTKEQAQWDCSTSVLPWMCGDENCVCCVPGRPITREREREKI